MYVFLFAECHDQGENDGVDLGAAVGDAENINPIPISTVAVNAGMNISCTLSYIFK